MELGLLLGGPLHQFTEILVSGLKVLVSSNILMALGRQVFEPLMPLLIGEQNRN